MNVGPGLALRHRADPWADIQLSQSQSQSRLPATVYCVLGGGYTRKLSNLSGRTIGPTVPTYLTYSTLQVSRPSRFPSDLLSVEQQYARGRRRRVGHQVDEQVGAARGDEEVTLAHHNGDDRGRASRVAHKELPVVQAPREERAW